MASNPGMALYMWTQMQFVLFKTDSDCVAETWTRLDVLQLYIKGEFVGGADIVEEMNEKGELKQMLRWVWNSQK